MRVSRFAILVAAGLALSAPAWADDDGSASNCLIVFCGDIDVANNAITTQEINNETILSEDIKNGEVKNVDLAGDAVTSDKIKDGEIKNSDLAANSVTSSKIQNGSVRKEDLSSNVQNQMNFNTYGVIYNGIWNWKQDQRIDSLETIAQKHEARLNAHSALLSEHAKGIAIAMAMPDAWIESNKRFAIAGSVGGFGDETAIGAAAILRLDDVWSINGKLGADTGFEEFGWTAGARASW